MPLGLQNYQVKVKG